MTTSAFVTGGSGFIGGALVRRLVADGWTVRALVRGGASAGHFAPGRAALQTTVDIRARTALGDTPVRTIEDGSEELSQS